MEIIGMACFAVALIVGLICNIQIIIIAFEKSVFWGLGYLCVPFFGFLFVLTHWEATKKPFIKVLFSVALYAIGLSLSPQFTERL